MKFVAEWLQDPHVCCQEQSQFGELHAKFTQFSVITGRLRAVSAHLFKVRDCPGV